MTQGNDMHETYKRFIKKRDCPHSRCYLADMGQEQRRIYNRDNPTGEYDVEFVDVEIWECPDCGDTWSYDVE